MHFYCGPHLLDLSRPQVMGVVNVTPDSFSDGGRYAATDQAIAHGLALAAEGAAVLDVGGESTRPGATKVPLDEELRRVIPVIEGLATRTTVPISIDTYKPEVMRAALAAGASIVNDVFALQQPGALEVVAASDAGVCLMHSQGTPQTMQQDPHYDNVVNEVAAFLEARCTLAMHHGIARQRILLDPGFGFGKRSAHNIALLRELSTFKALGQPLLVGLSRKSVLGQLTGQPVEDRLHASIAAAVIAAMQGARLLRVHDVRATVEALKIVASVTA